MKESEQEEGWEGELRLGGESFCQQGTCAGVPFRRSLAEVSLLYLLYNCKWKY